MRTYAQRECWSHFLNTGLQVSELFRRLGVHLEPRPAGTHAPKNARGGERRSPLTEADQKKILTITLLMQVPTWAVVQPIYYKSG